MLTNPSLNTERGMGKEVGEITWYLMTFLYLRGGGGGGDLGQIKMGRGEGVKKGGNRGYLCRILDSP